MSATKIMERGFRDALGSFATGVCVLGAVRGDGQPFGVTVNSFTSVSLDPPLVLVCLGNESPRTRAIIEAEDFAISILADDQVGMSDHFARPGEGLAPSTGIKGGDNGAPVVDGAAAVIECTLETTYPGGDHTILVGRVTHLHTDPGRAPLAYVRGGYASTSRFG